MLKPNQRRGSNLARKRDIAEHRIHQAIRTRTAVYRVLAVADILDKKSARKQIVAVAAARQQIVKYSAKDAIGKWTCLNRYEIKTRELQPADGAEINYMIFGVST